MIIRVPRLETRQPTPVVLVAAGRDDAVAAQADDGVDLYGRHAEGFSKGALGQHACRGPDGHDDGDVGLGAGRAPEDLVSAVARGEERGGGERAGAPVGERASLGLSALGVFRLAALIVGGKDGGEVTYVLAFGRGLLVQGCARGTCDRASGSAEIRLMARVRIAKIDRLEIIMLPGASEGGDQISGNRSGMMSGGKARVRRVISRIRRLDNETQHLPSR